MTSLGATFVVTCALALPPTARAAAPAAQPVAAAPVRPALPRPAAAVLPARPQLSTPAVATVVTLRPERRSLILGVDDKVRIDVTITGDGAAQAIPGPVETTVGTVEPLAPGPTPGAFMTVFHVPPDRRPQAALVSLEVALPTGLRLHGTTVIELPARTKFPFRTDPSAVVTLSVAGRSFGPVTADGRGNVAIPIVVPPGVETAQATARGRFGGVKEMEVDLQTRDYPRLLLFAPTVVEAGGAIDVEVWAVEPTGEPAIPEDVDLRASAGSVRRSGGASGVARFSVALPRDAAVGTVVLTASMNDGSSEKAQAVALRAGAAASLDISSSVPRLLVASAEAAEIEIEAADRWENQTSIEGIAVEVDGRPVAVEVVPEEGVARFRLPAPATWPGRERVVVAARLGALVARKEILLHGAAPAGIRVKGPSRHVVADGHASLDLVAEVFDRLGTPTTTERIVWSTPAEGTLQVLPSPAFGTYAARFTPSRSPRDHEADIAVTVDQGVTGSVHLTIETFPGRVVTARIGIVSNLRGVFGQSALIEGSVPWSRTRPSGRILSLGVATGYIHSDATVTGVAPMGLVTTAPPPPETLALHADVSLFPLLAFLRAQLPLPLPVEVSLVGLAGATWATSEITNQYDGSVFSRASTTGLAAGGGTEASLSLPPGELILGLRYLWLGVARLSNGDALPGNLGGLLVDVGYRLRL